ncbi:MAG: N-formylglutamate amidohydrolase [Nitrospira sp.]|nr:N-formylglutamate amidohydrolase [Nitrospira sp.]
MSPPLNYEVLCVSDEPKAPLLVHVPHSSTVVPAHVRPNILLDDRELQRELLVMTDWYTDQLFDHAVTIGGMMFVNRCSRLVVDPERFPNDADEIMAGRGMGAVYTKTSDGRRLRYEDDDALLDEFFNPYAAAMADQVSQILDRHGRCLVLDAHSFPSKPLPYELDQRRDRPELCIGTDAIHTPRKLAQAIRHICEEEGVTSNQDRPFNGTYVPQRFWRLDPRVIGVMIEVRRDLYMDETTGQPNGGFQQMRKLIGRIIKRATSIAATQRI